MTDFKLRQIFPLSLRHLSGVFIIVTLAVVTVILALTYEASYGHISSFFDAKESYDFIIVGGGPAGSIISKRLSQLNPGRRVILIEAGSDKTQKELWDGPDWTRFDIPAFWPTMEFMQSYAWEFPSSTGKSIYSFKGLGGCGMHNAMLYVRALPEDISTNWNVDDDVVDDDAWSWKLVLDAYMSLETIDSSSDYNTEFHGKSGLIHTWRGESLTKIDSSFLDSAVELGFRHVVDLNDPLDGRRLVGNTRGVVGMYDFNIHNGIRDSAALAMLSGDVGDDLTVLTNSLVEEIIIDYSNGGPEAVGVKIIDQKTGAVKSIYRSSSSSSSIVLTAGAIMTPHLLISSGIGPADEISEVCSDGPCFQSPMVGYDLQDHPFVPLVFQLASNSVHLMELHSVSDLVFDWSNMSSASNPLADPGISIGGFLWSSDALKINQSSPDIQITLFRGVFDPTVKKLLRKQSIDLDSSILVTVALMSPSSRGRVTSVNHKPFINSSSDYLCEQDVAKLAEGVSIVRQIVFGMNAVSSDEVVVQEEVYPGAAVKDDLVQNWVKKSALPNFHWCGTARMGNNIKDSVVDSRLRVHGVRGLRVADASIIPVIPNGNVHSTICMAAFRGAELISEDL